ncbi:hypothetical protein ACFVUS_24275 [Nocardia sp. NPDC058058]|uniref:hypothetical protein n=1 Tax=Nocardia sp. NPDC058058 TaxID=3346317 RepID=UPI0036D99A6F
MPGRGVLRDIAANLATALAICVGWFCALIVVGLVVSPDSRGAPHEAEGCFLIAPSPGMVDLDRTFDFTATVNSKTCDLQSALSRQPLRLQDVPAGHPVEIELTARKELSIRERGTSAKPLLADGNTSWTWELRPTLATSYELSLVVIVHDPDTDEIVDESEPLYLSFDAVPSNLRIVATSWNSLGAIPGAIAVLVAVLGIAAPLWLRVRGPGATCGGGIRRLRVRGSPYCRGYGRTRKLRQSQYPRG